MEVKRQITLPATGAELLAMLVESYNIRDGAGLLLAQSAAQAFDMALQAEAILSRDGLVIEGERGPRAHPATSISRDSRTRLLSALTKLHLEI